MTQEQKDAYEKSKERKHTNKAKDTLGQLQNNGEQAHQDALDIIDAIKNPGVVSGIGAGISKLLGDSLFDSLTEFSLDDVFSFMRGEDGTITSKLISKVKITSTSTEVPIIDEGGDYEIIIESEALVKTSVTFTRAHIPNTASSILIIITILGIVMALFGGLIFRNRLKVDEYGIEGCDIGGVEGADA